MKRAKDLAEFAVETVAFTFFLHHTTKQWPALLVNMPITLKACKDLKAELLKTNVVLTKQMVQLLADYEAGKFIPREGVAVDPLALSSAAPESGAAPEAEAVPEAVLGTQRTV